MKTWCVDYTAKNVLDLMHYGANSEEYTHVKEVIIKKKRYCL